MAFRLGLFYTAASLSGAFGGTNECHVFWWCSRSFSCISYADETTWKGLLVSIWTPFVNA